MMMDSIERDCFSCNAGPGVKSGLRLICSLITSGTVNGQIDLLRDDLPHLLTVFLLRGYYHGL